MKELLIIISLLQPALYSFSQHPKDKSGYFVSTEFKIRIGATPEIVHWALTGTTERRDSLVERFYYSDSSYLESIYSFNKYQGNDSIVTSYIIRWPSNGGLSALLKNIESFGYKKSIPTLEYKKGGDHTYIHASGKTGIQVESSRYPNQTMIMFIPDFEKFNMMIGKTISYEEGKYHIGSRINNYTYKGLMMQNWLEPPKRERDVMRYFEQEIYCYTESEEYVIELLKSLGFTQIGKTMFKPWDIYHIYRDLGVLFFKPFNNDFQIKATLEQYHDKVDKFTYTKIKLLLVKI